MANIEISQWILVLQAFASLVSALAWFAVAVVMVRLLPEIRARNVEEFSISGPLNTNFTLRTSRAVNYLSDAVALKMGKVVLGAISRQVHSVARPDVVRQVRGARVLWVDDIEDNTRLERRAMEALGIEFVTCRNTDEALRKLNEEAYDLIISDMGRPPDSRAGYTLLDAVRKEFPSIPFVIYSSSNAKEHKAEATRRGAQGATNDPRELLDIVLRVLSAG